MGSPIGFTAIVAILVTGREIPASVVRSDTLRAGRIDSLGLPSVALPTNYATLRAIATVAIVAG
jgi:hypothetical protein